MTKIHVSPLVFLMAAAMIFFGFGFECLSYLITVVMHEMAHAEVSKRLGYRLNGIKLMPYGASLTGAFEGVKSKHEILIALAGPASNVCIAVVFIAVWWLAPATYFFTEIFVLSNAYTAAFNLIPIFPLDGGRALLALLSHKIPRQKAYSVMRIFGFVLSALFAVLFALSLFYGINFSFAMISMFILLSTVFPDKNSKYQRLYSMAYRSEKIKQGLPVKEIMVDEDLTIMCLQKMLNANYYHRFCIVDKKLNVKNTVTETQIEQYSAKHGFEGKLKDLPKT